MEWSIQEIARLAGTTSRTLRHYDAIGLLPPSRIGENGYRYYDAESLVRLQRILLLRELGVGLNAIADVLEGQRDHRQALAVHADGLRRERDRLDDLIESVETTIAKLKRGETLMADEMLNGFDHTKYRDEVIERWGQDAHEKGDRWWREMSAHDRKEWAARSQELIEAWIEAAAKGIDPESDEAQALAQRQAEWLAGIPGTPRKAAGPTKAAGPGTKAGPAKTAGPAKAARPAKEYFIGLADMYVADERFARTYGGAEGAAFVRDAMRAYADDNL